MPRRRRNTYNYTYRVGRKVAHRGTTIRPEASRSGASSRSRPGGKLTVDGRAKTRDEARRELSVGSPGPGATFVEERA